MNGVDFSLAPTVWTGNQDVILCPICRGSFLHSKLPEIHDGNIEIQFYCEAGHEGVLVIYLHKGRSFIYWKHAGNSMSEDFFEKMEESYQEQMKDYYDQFKDES